MLPVETSAPSNIIEKIFPIIFTILIRLGSEIAEHELAHSYKAFNTFYKVFL